LHKGIQLIELLCEAEAPLGISAIAQGLGFNMHMTTRLVKTLLDAGWIIPAEGRKYRMGLRPFRFTSWPVARTPFRIAAAGPLRQLWQQTGECVHLGVLADDRHLLIEALDTVCHKVKITPPVGEVSPLHVSAPGKLMLVHGDKELLERVIAEGLERCTKKTICGQRKLATELKKIRERGWSLDIEEESDGIICLAAPVFDFTGELAGTICVSVLTMYHTPESLEGELGPKVLATAARISTALGYCETVAPSED